eukprot:1167905-Alexandrium_andersonii.AAC.1
MASSAFAVLDFCSRPWVRLLTRVGAEFPNPCERLRGLCCFRQFLALPTFRVGQPTSPSDPPGPPPIPSCPYQPELIRTFSAAGLGEYDPRCWRHPWLQGAAYSPCHSADPMLLNARAASAVATERKPHSMRGQPQSCEGGLEDPQVAKEG